MYRFSILTVGSAGGDGKPELMVLPGLGLPDLLQGVPSLI